jgi:uncharacterized protein
MKKAISLISGCLLLVIFSAGCSDSKMGYIKNTGPEVVLFRTLPFGLTDVKLLDGPFLHATELDIKTLLGYDPDRLLSGFFTEAGLKPRADHYMGWENESLAGHSLGHYLSANSMMFQTTGDNKFKERVAYIVRELDTIQAAAGTGYLGAFPKGRKVFENEVSKGNIRAKAFDLNGIWSPFYTEHKILAGLRDAWRYCGNRQALEVEKKFAGWIGEIVAPLSDAQMQDLLKCEYGGISETLADLYADTGDKKYLALSRRFYDNVVLDALKERKDILPGRHGNTNIPKLIALSRLYELTGDTTDRQAAEFFWNTVTQHHSYVTGGNGNKEYFGPADSLSKRLGPETTESCNVYNMLKLTGHLFEWNASPAAADYYERALFNHILATQNPETGNVTYNLSLGMGYFKAFQDPGDFTCCIGTGMENHSKYAGGIYYHNNEELYLFQYIASELNWKEKGLRLVQKTAWPEEQGTVLELNCAHPVQLTLQIRYPSWAAQGIDIRVNEKPVCVTSAPGSFIPIDRVWKSGDRVEVKIPFTLRLEPTPDNPKRVAVMYGPLVMAGELGQLSDSLVIKNMPVLAPATDDPSSWLKPVEGKINTFITADAGKPHEIEFCPFYTVYDKRYSIYFDMKLDKESKQVTDAKN